METVFPRLPDCGMSDIFICYLLSFVVVLFVVFNWPIPWAFVFTSPCIGPLNLLHESQAELFAPPSISHRILNSAFRTPHHIQRRLVGEAARQRAGYPHPAWPAAPARRNEQVIVKMPGKGLEHRVGSALGVSRPGEVGVETLDGHADSPDTFLGAVPAAPGVLAQEIGNLFQLTPRLGLDRLDFPLVFEHRLQLALLAPQPPDGLGVVQPETALLNDLVRPARLAVNAPGLQRQGQSVQRLRWWMQQEPDDVERALLVFENRVPAFKREFPEAQVPAQGILASASVVAICSLLSCSHRKLAVFVSWSYSASRVMRLAPD